MIAAYISIMNQKTFFLIVIEAITLAILVLVFNPHNTPLHPRTFDYLLSVVLAAEKADSLRLACFPGVEVGKDQEFTIDTKGAGGQGKLDVTILSPSRKVVPCLVSPVTGRESSMAKFIPREEGIYAVDVTYDGNPVPGSPFTVDASLPPDPTKVSFIWILLVVQYSHMQRLAWMFG